MNFNKNQIIFFGGIFLIITFFILVFMGLIPGLRHSQQGNKQINLTIWGIENENYFSDALRDFSSNYQGNINIIYKEIPKENYEDDLVNALAEGKGPDIFMIKDNWLPKHWQKIYPLSSKGFSLENYFPEIVKQEFSPNNIYALPLYIDTLSLIYNKDLLNQAGIAVIPKTWDELEKDIPRLVKEKNGELIQAGIALGGTMESIPIAPDILSALMLQAGCPMVSDDFSSAQFTIQTENNFYPGLNALRFYTHFANPENLDYSWNDNLGNYLDAFSNGKVAFILGYKKDIPIIKEKNPYLNFGVSYFPQIDLNKPLNYPSYWGLTVSKQSLNPDIAWDLVKFLTLNPQVAENYLKVSGHPPALRVLIKKYYSDDNYKIFTYQSLNAKSWFQIDPLKIGQIFSNMIKFIVNGKMTAEDALSQAEAQVNYLMKNNNL